MGKATVALQIAESAYGPTPMQNSVKGQIPPLLPLGFLQLIESSENKTVHFIKLVQDTTNVCEVFVCLLL